MSDRTEKVIVFLPAYFAEKSLASVYRKIPKELIHEIILIDDDSRDGVEPIAKSLGIKFFRNNRNLGYGGNLKACMKKALELGGDILIELHPDDQYDPAAIPQAIQKIKDGNGLVMGSRFVTPGLALKYKMPLWKYIINRCSTPLCRFVLGVKLSDFHCGFRAYHRRFLEAVNFIDNDDDYLFSFQIIMQAVLSKTGINEIPVICHYYPNVTQINFKKCILYGLGVLRTFWFFLLARLGWKKISWLYPKRAVSA